MKTKLTYNVTVEENINTKEQAVKSMISALKANEGNISIISICPYGNEENQIGYCGKPCEHRKNGMCSLTKKF